jgi:hypothetical protein
MLPPSLLVLFSGEGLIDLPLRASTKHLMLLQSLLVLLPPKADGGEPATCEGWMALSCFRVASTWAPSWPQRGPYTGRGARTGGLVDDRT